jgi:hypothetical protein
MKILGVRANNRTKTFEVASEGGDFSFPYAKFPVLQERPHDRIMEVFPDDETGREAFTFRLESGAEDTAHLDAVREYNKDPEMMNEILIHNLTVEALEALESSGMTKRQLMRALGTSPSQLYRLLDPTYYGKSLGQMAALLHLLGREVEVVVRPLAT